MRVGIEDEAINAAEIMGSALGIEPELIIGKLVRLWHVTQNAEMAVLPDDTIYRIFDRTLTLDKDSIISLLTEFGFIKKIDSKNFVIRGNKRHIERLKELRKRAKKGGVKSAKSRAVEPHRSSGSLSTSSSCSSTVQFEPYTILSYTKKNIDADASHSTGVETDLRAPLSLVDLWNQHCGRLAKVRKPVSPARERKIRARWKETPPGEKPVDYWTAVVKRIAASDFCCGKNQNGWRASFDWILQPEVREKVLEGKYDTRSGTEAIDWSKVFGDEK